MARTETLSLTVSHDEYHALRGLHERTMANFDSALRLELVHPVATRGFVVDVVCRVVLEELASGRDPREALMAALAEHQRAYPARA